MLVVHRCVCHHWLEWSHVTSLTDEVIDSTSVPSAATPVNNVKQYVKCFTIYCDLNGICILTFYLD